MEQQMISLPDPASDEGFTATLHKSQRYHSQHVASHYDWKHTFVKVFWDNSSDFDAWLTACSFQIAQVLLTLPYSFSQLGLISGIIYQICYALMGCWSCFMVTSLYMNYRDAAEKQNVRFDNHTIQWYEILGGLLGPRWRAAGLIFNTALLFCQATIGVIACGSIAYYINDTVNKRTWICIFGGCLMSTILIPRAHNYRIWSFVGIIMTTFTAWYLTAAAIIHGKDPNVEYTAPRSMIQYFTGSTNMLYMFGGHAATVEIMHAMKKPGKFKTVYLYSVMYILTLTLPSAISVYVVFGDKMLNNSYAFAVLPKSKYRDTAVVLMLLHQFIQFGLLTLPLHLVWEKLLGIHETRPYLIRTVSRVPLVLILWLIGLMIPFVGVIDSAVGSLVTSFAVYILPCMAHMMVHRSRSSRLNSIEKPPFWMPGWIGVFCINVGVITWVLMVGVGFGAWASIHNLLRQLHSFGIFPKCYQCPTKKD